MELRALLIRSLSPKVLTMPLKPPVIVVKAPTVAHVWQAAVLEVWFKGVEVPTEYGEKAKEATLIMIIENPLRELSPEDFELFPKEALLIRRKLTILRKLASGMVHPADALAVRGLRDYLNEVLHGDKDALVKTHKLSYTYHERLFSYGKQQFNQIRYVVEKLKKIPYTRRAQAITWIPGKDTSISSPPCLQRLWFKLYSGGSEKYLVMQSEWRSRDLFRAANMNMLAMVELQRAVAEELGTKVGWYLDFSNSAHIYESSYGDVERFVKAVKSGRGLATKNIVESWEI